MENFNFIAVSNFEIEKFLSYHIIVKSFSIDFFKFNSLQFTLSRTRNVRVTLQSRLEIIVVLIYRKSVAKRSI